MTTVNEVLDKLSYLKLNSAHTYLKELHINDNISNTELKGIDKILRKEVEAKERNNKLYNVKVAAFPFVKTVDDYDFTFQPSIQEEKIRSLIASDFHENGTNVIFVGNPGVGNYRKNIIIESNAFRCRNLGNYRFISFDNKIK